MTRRQKAINALYARAAAFKSAADDGGIIQAEQALLLWDDPRHHTCTSVRHAIEREAAALGLDLSEQELLDVLVEA